MMAAVKWFLVFVLVVGDVKVLCFPSGESEKLKTLSLQGLQGHLATSDSSGGSPGTTLSQTSLAANDKSSITGSGKNHIRSFYDCCWECRHIVCVTSPCCINHCCCDHCKHL
ncbi:hypothetical protein UPYG_G00349660 [Umbra pygmaea]|uniref:Uncharacterized protein n=1 Tax=Umbra pygmaea TaxID=75934 RepID=A0ABD0W2B5_UMBPY